MKHLKLSFLSISMVSGLLASVTANAAGYEFSRFNFTNLYTKQNTATLSYSWFTYDIDGQDPQGKNSSGTLLDDLHYWQASVNYLIDDKWSANLQYYRAYNVDTYHQAGIYQGSGAYLNTQTIALTGMYKIDDNFSVFGGPTVSRTKINIKFDGALLGNKGNIHTDFGSDNAYGFTLGASYQVPAKALRATIGYQSPVKFYYDTVETGSLASAINGQSSLVLPHKVTFDFQTGIAPKTLLTFNMHWSNWSDNTLDSASTLAVYKKPFVTFAHNTFDYTLGVAYQFTPQYAMFAQGIYSEGAGVNGVVNALAPSNGATGVKIGGRYNLDDISLFLVAQNMWLKDGKSPEAAGSGVFVDNSVFTMSMGMEYRF